MRTPEADRRALYIFEGKGRAIMGVRMAALVLGVKDSPSRHERMYSRVFGEEQVPNNPNNEGGTGASRVNECSRLSVWGRHCSNCKL